MTVAVASCYASAPAWAVGGADLTAVVGSYTSSQSGSVLTLTTATDRTIAEARERFNILANEQLRVLQPSSSSLFLLRVLPGQSGVLEKSVIDGSIYSNGQFWLQNAAGALIGKGAVIDTAGFLATNMAVRLEDFMAGRLTSLQNIGGTGGIVNQGEIKTSSGGSVYLIGDKVTNEGIITTPGGETILAAGQTVNLIDTGTPGVKVEITGAAGDVTNLGEIVATAGRIGMAGVIVRNSGTLNASSVVSEGGRVFLKASKDAYVDGAGRIVATGTKSGKVEVLGERVAVMDQAQIDVSGTNGGGTVLVGGDYQGKNPDVQNAKITYFGREASIKANATDNGDGGKVIVWADDTTRAYGAISARAGAQGGDGGFVEVSGKRYLDFDATADTRAPAGKAGRLLLDPINITINNTADVLNGGDFAAYGTGVFSPASTSDSTITWATINGLLGTSNVLISTYGGGASAGNITVAGVVVGTPNWANSLTLVAHNNVTFNNTFWLSPSGAGGLNVFAGWDGNWSGTAWASAPTVTANTGVISVNGSYISLDTGALNFVAGSKIEVIASGTYSSGIQTRNGGAMNLSALGTAAGTGIFVDATAVTANNRSAFIESSGNQTLSGYDVEVRAANTAPGSFSEAHIRSAGTQTVSASRLKLVAGATGSGNRATLESVGDQSISLSYAAGTALLVEGGGVGSSDYGNVAKIEHTGAGNQSITLTGNGGIVEIRGGDGYGGMPAGYWSGECASAGVCSGNDASIYNASGSQSIAFSGAGGYLNLYGGGGDTGTHNSARIENKGTGTQSITGSANISLYGGTAGGATIVYGGKVETLDNSAGIESKYGAQSITAGVLYMYGGTAEYGGAYISAPTQNITAGALTIEGGGLGTTHAGVAPSAYDTYGDDVWYNPAVIGHDAANTINLSLGTLTMNGGVSSGYGGSAALIGGYRVASTVTIASSGAVQLNSANQWSDRIGSLGGYGGTVSLTTSSGSIALGKAYVGTGTTGSVTTSGYGGVTQGALGRIETSTLTASATGPGAAIDLSGENKAATVIANAAGSITYKSVMSTLISSMTSTASSIAVDVTNPYAYGGTARLGTLSAASGTVSVTAAQQILDENGSGTGNISAQGITLVSTNGTTDNGGIAISADIALTGGAKTVSAIVQNTATYGGISLRNGSSTAPLSVSMDDQSTTSGHAELSYVSGYDINMATGAYNLSSNRGGITLGTTGNLTLSSLATFFAGTSDANYRYIKMSGQNVATTAAMGLNNTPDLYINANGTLTVGSGHNITAARNVGLNAVGGLTMTNATISAGANVYLGGVDKYGGGAITLTGSAVSAGNGIYAYTGGDIRLNDGSHLSAGNDVNLGLGGTTSTVYLNDSTGYVSPSYILAGAAYGANVGFLARSAGGIVIDGATTMASTAYGSGIFRGGHGSPAASGAGLNVLYGVAASAAVTEAVNAVVSTIVTTTSTATSSVSSGSTSSTSTTSIPPPTTTTTGTSSGLAALSSGTVGGAAGQFGDTSSTSTTAGTTTTSTSTSTTTTSGTTATSESSSSTTSTASSTASGESTGQSSSTSDGQSSGSKDAKDEKKEDKKDDKSKKADSGEKKDDKTKQKPVGKCSA